MPTGYRNTFFDPTEGERWCKKNGINPAKPTDFNPGSEAKVMLITARYEIGLPLNLPGDRSEHQSIPPVFEEVDYDD